MGKYLKYKDYLGTVEFNSDDNILHGLIFGINDLVTFEADNIQELKEAFETSVDDYLETCLEIGKEPNKLFKGVFNVRTTKNKHAYLAKLAAKKDLKLNDLINKTFDYLEKNEDIVLN